MKQWRSILDSKNSASFNMAADAYLLKTAEKDVESPVFRIYGWDRPSITLGYNQKFERAVNPQKLGSTPVVRRITGGRALLHDDGELTYSVSGNFVRYPQLGQSLHESYHLISRAIVVFYDRLGWPASISQRDHPVLLNQKGALQKGCFASVSRYEIIAGGIKIAAGSQRRTQTSFMQHGSIKIAAPKDHPAIADHMQPAEIEPLKTSDRGYEELVKTLIEGFNQIFEVRFICRPFSEMEKAAVTGLMARFGNLNSR